MKEQTQSRLIDDDVEFVALLADGSKRAKKDHHPSGVSYSTKFNVHREMLGDSVTAGKTGKSQAQHLYYSLPAAAQCKLGAILFDTTSSNTGELHGLAAELDRQT